MELSSLRVAGLIVGLIGLYVTFTIYRGPRWKRANFVFFGIFSFALVTVSINPNVLNHVAEILKLEQQQRGRVLALLIGSSIILWFLVLSIKAYLKKE